MLFFLREDVFEDAAGGRVFFADVLNDLAVTINRDPLGHQVFVDHLLQIVAGYILCVGHFRQHVRIELRFAAQLHNTLGQSVSVFAFLLGVFEKLIGGGAGLQTAGHEVVTFVAQNADQFSGQRFVEQAQHLFTVGAVAFSYGAVLDVLARTFAQGLDIRQMQVVAHFSLLEANPIGATLYRRDRLPRL